MIRMRRLLRSALAIAAISTIALTSAFAQAMVNETRDPGQKQDAEFAKLYATWTGEAKYGSPLVDHLPRVAGIPTPKDVLGYYIGAPAKLTYYADILKYYRALAKASPRVKIETIGKSDEGPRARRGLDLVRREHPQPRAEPRQPREDRRSARDERSPGSRDHGEDEAALSLHGRPAQRRDRSVGNADGARVSPGRRRRRR